MKTIEAVILAVVLLCSCGERHEGATAFTIETINKATPVKDQGHSDLCWVYAMLATIESDRLMMGDSVNLSPHFVARAFLERQVERCYLADGSDTIAACGVAPMTLALMEEYGAMTFDAYRSECNYNSVCRELNVTVRQAAKTRIGFERLRERTADMLDRAINPMPKRVWMYGAEYTTEEFAQSLCHADDYVSLTSYTHFPFGVAARLDLPADQMDCKFVNVPIDSLVTATVKALQSGRSVCWEGDITNAGFSFADGVARTEWNADEVTQDMRQHAFERFSVTDDHCMAIIGLARDGQNRRHFVCKNSWGTANPYGGMMYMSEDYFRLNTIAVVMKRD